MTYEIVSILSPKLSDEDVKTEQDALRALVEQHEGTVLREDAWGKRELAYPIKKMSHGIYVQTDFEAESSFVAELDRQLKLREGVLRFLTLKKEKGLGSLSDFARTASADGEEGEEAPKTVEEATSTPDVLAASTKATGQEEKKEIRSAEVSDEKKAEETPAKEEPKAEEDAESRPDKKKAGMEDLDKKLDDILDSALDEEVK